ncbi:MAG: ABC transporter substrate-binding protein [Bowdeniella nasicola]|nr:ABC transporter substrate-binding protein [Bowdeniella nasicola]
MTRLTIPAVLTAAALTLVGCSDPNTADTPAPEGNGEASAQSLTVGSAAFPESEIIAEIYAQALESTGLEVERSMQIGAREVYAPALEGGEIDVVPDYTGNLLAYYDPETEATGAEEIEAALPEALPEGTEILAPAPAEDKDSLNVTRAFAEEHSLTSIADLAGVDAFAIAANPEFAERSYGIPGLEKIYGLSNVRFVPINDGGGPATVQALLDGDVQVANVYSTTPAIKDNDLVTLEDPESMIAAQHVTAFVKSGRLSDGAVQLLERVNAALTTEDLIEMNGRSSGDEKAAPAVIAKDWLAASGITG